MRIVPIFVLATALILTGCAGNKTFTEQELASLDSISYVAAQVSGTARKTPDATASPNAATSVSAGAGGGILPFLVGAAIDGAVTNSQQNSFEEHNALYLDAVDAMLPGDLGVRIDKELTRRLEEAPFFASRMSATGETRLAVTVIGYNMKRLSKTGDDVCMGFAIHAQVQMLSPELEKPLLDQPSSATSTTCYNMKSYAENSSLMDQVVHEAVADLAASVLASLTVRVPAEA